MRDLEQARALADSMVRVGAEMQTPVTALISRMDCPLGRCAGNALEVAESVAVLRGEAASGPLWEITRACTVEMLRLGFPELDENEAGARVDHALQSGRGLEIFASMVEAQGGDPAVCEHPEKLLPRARIRENFPAPRSGWVADVDAEAVGRAVLLLGGGRTRAEDRIDPAAGLEDILRVGEAVEAGQPLCSLHAGDPGRLRAAREWLDRAFRISETPPETVSVVRERRAAS
jgi:thymidine phosphorylase